jgi:hypothetical protein
MLIESYLDDIKLTIIRFSLELNLRLASTKFNKTIKMFLTTTRELSILLYFEYIKRNYHNVIFFNLNLLLYLL